MLLHLVEFLALFLIVVLTIYNCECTGLYCCYCRIIAFLLMLTVGRLPLAGAKPEDYASSE